MTKASERYTLMALSAKHSDPNAYARFEEMLRKARRDKRKHGNAWDNLLEPVQQQLRNLQSSRQKWADRSYAELYLAYMEMLKKVRTRIQAAAQSAELLGQSVQECAEAKGVKDYKGTRWSAWVPLKVRDAFLKEFDKARAMNPKVRMIVPFHTPTERNANERRWEILEATMRSEREKYGGLDVPNTMLNHAEARARARTISTHAPITWTQLLDKTQRETFDAWQTRTMDGLRPDSAASKD
jgi:rubrerythrin